MAMYSWEVMPPPAGLEKNLGERRLTGYAGTGRQQAHAAMPLLHAASLMSTLRQCLMLVRCAITLHDRLETCQNVHVVCALSKPSKSI